MTKFNRFDPRNKKNNRNKKNTQNNTVKIKNIYEDKMKYDIASLIKKNDNDRETQ